MRRGFPGAKPDAFCYWIFEGLNLVPDDEFHDVSPEVGRLELRGISGALHNTTPSSNYFCKRSNTRS